MVSWLLTGTPEQRYWQNRETANVGLDSSVGRAPARQSGGRRFKSRSSQFSLFIQIYSKYNLDFLFCRIGYYTIIAGSLVKMYTHCSSCWLYLMCVAIRCPLSVNQLNDRESLGLTVGELTGNSHHMCFDNKSCSKSVVFQISRVPNQSCSKSVVFQISRVQIMFKNLMQWSHYETVLGTTVVHVTELSFYQVSSS